MICNMDQDTRAAWVPLITQRRLGLGWTQLQLAERAGVSLKTIGNLESGEITPQGKTIKAVTDALNLPRDLEDARAAVAGDLKNMGDDFGLAISGWTRVDQDQVNHRMQNLDMEDPLDQALARLRDAAAELVKAEDDYDEQMHEWAVRSILQDQFGDLMREATAAAGRELTPTERREVANQLRQPSVGEIAEYIASSAIHDAREWSRYEMALIEFIYEVPDDVRFGSTYADLQPHRERVRQLTVDEAGVAPEPAEILGRPTPMYRAVGYVPDPGVPAAKESKGADDSATQRDDYSLVAHDEETAIEDEQGHDEHA